MKISKIIELIKDYPDVELSVSYTNADDQQESSTIGGVIIEHDSEGEASVSLKMS